MTNETIYKPLPGYGMLLLTLVLFFGSIAGFVLGLGQRSTPMISVSIAVFLASLLLACGFLVINPNESQVTVLFGAYRGTVKASGFHWANPFLTKTLVSLRANNLNGSQLKVNDKLGNPIEIAAVIVWQVRDTAKAAFEVTDYKQFVVIQSEAAVRHLANSFSYDHFSDEGEAEEITLRGGGDKVNELLEYELNQRLAQAGILVTEARISHLAYAPEIAGAMLQRQQATAIVAARRQIVEGAVGMVEMALEKLAQRQIVTLDEEKKAAMVSNLLVVLCGERGATPVLNTGTLHQ